MCSPPEASLSPPLALTPGRLVLGPPDLELRGTGSSSHLTPPSGCSPSLPDVQLLKTVAACISTEAWVGVNPSQPLLPLLCCTPVRHVGLS